MYFSNDERITLIKSTISNLPTYFMSFFFPSWWCYQSYREVIGTYYGVGLGDEFKFHMVSWSKVCFSIFEGGLGSKTFFC
jgi:hypothetical protein